MTSAPPISTGDIAILMPVYNDWDSAETLIGQLDASQPSAERFHVILVDDASPRPPPPTLGDLESNTAILSVRRVRLKRNLSHQRSIAIGLSYIYGNLPCRSVIVMDADGEDRAEDAWKLLRHADERSPEQIVFAERARRSEGVVFRLGYAIYRVLHRVLTGVSVRVGNFSVIPAAHLPAVVSISELWNHYAAGIFKARIPRTTLPIDRGARLAGQSQMNVMTLVMHGLSAVSVFSEIVGTRALIFLLLCSAGTAGLAAVGGLLLATLGQGKWPHILLTVGGIGFAVSFVASWLTLFFVLGVLHLRSGVSFLPARDYDAFVSDVEFLYGQPQ